MTQLPTPEYGDRFAPLLPHPLYLFQPVSFPDYIDLTRHTAEVNWAVSQRCLLSFKEEQVYCVSETALQLSAVRHIIY